MQNHSDNSYSSTENTQFGNDILLNPSLRSVNPFKTFWMAGFECSDLLNAGGDRVDLLEMTGHLKSVREDYRLIESLGLQTVREGIRWSVVEYKPYQYDFSAVLEMIKAGRECGVQQIWDICHFGFPDDLSPFHPQFGSRLVSLCKAFVLFYQENNPGEMLFVTPINEVSFLSWLGGDAAATVPYCRKTGWEVKYALMRAYILAVKAMKEISNSVRIVTTEPLVNMVPGLEPSAEDLAAAAIENEQQFQCVDMLCGRMCPELGGSIDFVDIVGFNFYYNNQWIIGGGYEFLGWNDPVPDPRWRPLADLLEAGYLRYGKPIILSETSHPKEDRPQWVEMIANQCAEVIDRKVPLFGICIYPIIDRPDWDHPDVWHNSGLWDHDSTSNNSRVLHQPSATALQKGKQLIDLHLKARLI